jgi:chaperonin GroEL
MEEVKLVKELAFGDNAKSQILAGVEKLTNAVASTLGASGKCVILEDHTGNPIITKDGVTVANAVNLRHPIENIGATLIKGKLLKEQLKMPVMELLLQLF